jgi:hypothetical protein
LAIENTRKDKKREEKHDRIARSKGLRESGLMLKIWEVENQLSISNKRMPCDK